VRDQAAVAGAVAGADTVVNAVEEVVPTYHRRTTGTG
jgi:hypothetical protein